MDPAAYLVRIGYRGRVPPTLSTLRALHRQHLLQVPFENLDIHLGRPIVLDEAAFFDKIVTRRRGGFCYELNGLFAWLLERLGFAVTRLSARVTSGDRAGPEFDHLALLVQVAGERWLVDVGFGQSFVEPLRLERALLQEQADHAYRLIEEPSGWVMSERAADGVWSERYRFTLVRRRLGEFAARCRYHQESSASTFTQQRVCSRLLPGGRLTLTDDTLIETIGRERRETPVTGDARYRALLRDRFDIDLQGAPWRVPGRGSRAD